MKHTRRQLTETTLVDLLRAKDNRRPVTITYVKADGTETIRTIEIHEVRTTTQGNVILRAADRQSGEMRTWRTDRIRTYTTHRGTYQIHLPETERPAVPEPRTAAELVDAELARDEATADRRYWTDRYDTEPADYDHAA